MPLADGHDALERVGAASSAAVFSGAERHVASSRPGADGLCASAAIGVRAGRAFGFVPAGSPVSWCCVPADELLQPASGGMDGAHSPIAVPLQTASLQWRDDAAAPVKPGVRCEQSTRHWTQT